MELPMDDTFEPGFQYSREFTAEEATTTPAEEATTPPPTVDVIGISSKLVSVLSEVNKGEYMLS